MKKKDKIIIITGAPEGAGKATSKQFYRLGAKRDPNGRSKSDIQKLSEELKDSSKRIRGGLITGRYRSKK